MRFTISIPCLVSYSPWALVFAHLDCLAIGLLGGVLNEILALGTAATSFCHSYITDGPMRTSYVAQTTTSTEIATTTLPLTTTVYVQCPAGTLTPERRRAGGPVLNRRLDPLVSRACTCLDLVPTTTTTVTSTNIVAVTSYVSVTGTVPVATTTSCLSCTPSGGRCILGQENCCSGSAVIDAQFNCTCD